MRVLILGNSGLIGQDFFLYNRIHHEFELLKIGTEKRWPDEDFKAAIIDAKPDAIINAISSSDYDDSEKMNSVHYELPVWLAENMKCKLILFSSDVVGQLERGIQVDPKFSSYAEAKLKMEKQLASYPLVKIFRTSIVGLAKTPSNLLYKFFWNNPSNTINAFANAYWSGITTLQLFRVITTSLKEKWEHGIIKAGSDRISMFDFLYLVNSLFGFEKKINKQLLPEENDRSFASDIRLPELSVQLVEMRNLVNN